MGGRIRSIKALINCTIKPLDEYGLYGTYKSKLFCLLSRVSINMFPWELVSVNSDYRLVTLSNINSYKSLLTQVDIYEPPEVFIETLAKDMSLLGPYKTHDELMEVAHLRLWQWQKHFRGKLDQNQNQVKVQFKSRLNSDQDQKLKLFLTALFGTY